jgi:C-terminal processing protease CtpA/Prc
MRLHFKPLIATSCFSVLFNIVLLISIFGCESDTINEDSSNIVNNVIDFEGDLEISDFVWKSLNQYYFWQNEVPKLSDSISADLQNYEEFILKNKDPEVFFDNLMHPDDKFSFIEKNYSDLENLIQGVIASNGVEFGLLFACNNCRQLIGYVKYILPGSDASEKDIKRGDLFSGVNGIQLKIDNYRELLFNDNLDYTLNMVSINNGVFVNNGKDVSLSKKENLEINPILINQVLNIENTKVGYLLYNQFVADKSPQLNQIFGDFKNNEIDDLIIDLRYNGGGSVKNCIELASMITGQFQDQVFVQEQWNSKMTESLTLDNGEEYFLDRFISTLSDGETINSLYLNRVFILTSSESASASELLINGLKPFIEVIHIGERTVGKNLASITLYDYVKKFIVDVGVEEIKNPDHTYALQPIVLKIANKDGFSDYSEGLEPNYNIKESILDFGVLGDIEEPLLSFAISLINGKETKFTLKNSTIPLNKVKDPLMISRQGMFLDKNTVPFLIN